jgi:hypothetical protein
VRYFLGEALRVCSVGRAAAEILRFAQDDNPRKNLEAGKLVGVADAVTALAFGEVESAVGAAD